MLTSPLGLGSYLGSRDLDSPEDSPPGSQAHGKKVHLEMRCNCLLFFLVTVRIFKEGNALLKLLKPFQALRIAWLKPLMPLIVSLQVIAPACLADDVSLQDQLKKVQKEQVSEQVRGLEVQRTAGDSSLRAGYVSRSLVAKAIVTLLPARSDIDPTQYPFGVADAMVIDGAFNNDQAALLCSAVGRQAAPVAAKKYLLQGLKFPLFMEMNTKDLMFPYTSEAWLNSPLSADNMAITCILDPDGRLSTPEVTDRYGFGISDSITKEDGVVTRAEAKVNINFQSDGRPYTESELELLGRIDNELDRLGFSSPPLATPNVASNEK